MGKISMVMCDLSGTTVQDDMGVRDCLYQAAQEFKLKTTPEEICTTWERTRFISTSFSSRERWERRLTSKISNESNILKPTTS